MSQAEIEAQIMAARQAMMESRPSMEALEDALRLARADHTKRVNTYCVWVERLERQIGHEAMVARLQAMAA